MIEMYSDENQSVLTTSTSPINFVSNNPTIINPTTYIVP